ncbi:TetR/AcrR family transcriptional regulator [Peterkaempfera griseoplana]|uniref:TetR/AcrR family transcriptional regulator n=1 Tax=Peterkaempfera griseoplana TaxID=66896 RepID=UPI0006E3A335|nr:TetR/AcrR family transcriptional regulator [Peterkaempfera griseoplana]
MTRPGENLRVRRTQTLLRGALVELIEERGFDKVTVGQVTERAMVSRASFYRNYRDKYHLVEQIFDEAMAELLDAADGSRSPLERWVGFFEHIDACHRFYGALLGRKGSPWFADRMRTALASMVTTHLEVPEDGAAAPGPALVPAVLAAVLLQSVTWWLENGRPLPPREIATRSARLAGALIAEANGWTAPPR